MKNKNYYFSKNNKTFCIQPWISGHVAFNRFYNCEFETSDLIDKSLNNLLVKSNSKSIKNLPHYNELRKAMIEDNQNDPTLNKICNKCLLSKSWGLNNGHHLANKIFHDSFDEYVLSNTNEDGSLIDINKKIKYLHLSFSNICNKCCIFCSPTRSNIIAKIYNNNVFFDKNYYSEYEYRIDKKYLKNAFKLAEEAEIIHASVAGEPLVQEEFYAVLEHLIEKQNTEKTILLNTNLYNLSFKNKSAIDLLKPFKQVILLISLQGFDKENSIIMDRSYNPDSYYRIINNIEIVRESIPTAIINIHCSINLINYERIFEYHQYPIEKNLITQNEFILDYVFEKPLALSYLPVEMREKYITKIDNHFQSITNQEANFFGDTMQYTFNGLKDYLLREKDVSFQNKDFKCYITEINKIKNVDVAKELPHIQELLEYYEKF